MLKERLYKLVKENNVQLGTVYFQLTRGVAQRNHEFPPMSTKPVFIAFTTEKGIPEKELLIKVDEKIIGNGIPGNITRKLQALIRERILRDVRSLKKKAK